MHLPDIKDFDFAPWIVIACAVLLSVFAIAFTYLTVVEAKKPRGDQDRPRLILGPLFTLVLAFGTAACIVTEAHDIPYTAKLVAQTQGEAQRVYGVHLDRKQLRYLFTDQQADSGHVVINDTITRYGHTDVSIAGKQVDATLYKVDSEYLLVDASKIATGGIIAGQLPHS